MMNKIIAVCLAIFISLCAPSVTDALWVAFKNKKSYMLGFYGLFPDGGGENKAIYGKLAAVFSRTGKSSSPETLNL